MADPALLDLLKQGRLAWNEYVRECESPTLDLNGADLRGRDLVGIDLRGAFLSNANLSGCGLSGARLERVYAVAVNLTDADLSGATLHGATFSTGICENAKFARANASKASFSNASLDNADFTDARLRRTAFTGANLRQAAFHGAHLEAAVFWGAELANTNFAGAAFDGTIIGATDLSEANGLAAITHDGPSCIDAATLLRSRNLPEVFLKGIGVPESLIAYRDSLAASSRAIQLYSCFISYSSKDAEFCRRLHNDLQAAGVRCWFAPEDLKIGEHFRTRIEQSIKVYDKLLIVLSDHSIASLWVGEEIEAAFEKEDQRKQPVLFPIRLDDAVLDSDQGWARSIKRTRHIGDFTGWKDHDAYQRAFDRLMRDLKASGDTPPAST